MRMKIFVVVLVLGLACQAYSQKSGHNHKHKHAKNEAHRKEPVEQAQPESPKSNHQQHQQQQQNSVNSAAIHQQQASPQIRQCECDELEKCYQEQTTNFDGLTSQCRHQCGLAFLTNDTAEHVANCYDAFEKSKRDQKTNKHRCVENLIAKPCIIGNHQQPSPSQATLTVDPTKIAQRRPKRNFKHLLPPNLNMYASCVKICRKNGGTVQFNPDGTLAKTVAANGQQMGQIPQTPYVKPGKGYAACAQKLNCQLVPTDKKLEKQAKQICKYETAQTEDHGHTLCACLEGVFNQNFQCDPTIAVQGTQTCNSASSESAEGTGCTGKKTAP